jgi:hypothetical protein
MAGSSRTVVVDDKHQHTCVLCAPVSAIKYITRLACGKHSSCAGSLIAAPCRICPMFLADLIRNGCYIQTTAG